MTQDAAASGAQSDADSTKTGETATTATVTTTSDAGTTGEPQPDIEKIVAARVAQKLKSYGDLDDLKRKATSFETLEEEKKTETQRVTEQLAEFQRREADLKRELQNTRLHNAVESTATRLGFAAPHLAPRLVDAATVEFDDAGNPTNVELLLAALLKAEPSLVASRMTGTANGGVRVTTDENVQPGFDRLRHAYESTEKRS